MKTPQEHIEAAERALDEVHRLELNASDRDSMRKWHHMDLALAHIGIAEAIALISQQGGDASEQASSDRLHMP